MPFISEAIAPTSATAVTALRGTASEIPDNLGGATIYISGDPTDLQNKLNASINADGTHKGNTLVVPVGYQAAPNLQFPPTKGPGYTCIRTAGAIVKGQRIADASQTFRTIGQGTVNDSRAFTIPAGADGYRIVGMEATHPNDNFTYALAEISGKRLSLESSLLHAHSATHNNRRGLYLLEAEDVQIWDSQFYDFHEIGSDAQTIFARRTKRLHIENCELQASGENLLFGDQDSGSASLDSVIRRCHFLKPLDWQAAGAPAWTIKNLLEFKFASRVQVEGNVFENNWAMAQDGTAWLINCGMAQWGYGYLVQDVLFQNNTVINAPYLISINTVDSAAVVPARIALLNNLGLRIQGRLILLNHAAADVWLEHNTVTPQRGTNSPQGAVFLAPDFNGAFPRFTMKRNVFGLGTYGIFANGGRTDWGVMMPDRTWAENAEYDQPQSPAPGITAYATPAAAGVNLLDGTLTPTSPLKGAGTDGKDLGVDFVALNALGNPPPPSPPPTGKPMPTIMAAVQGSLVNVTWNDTSGGQYDWIALTPVGTPATDAGNESAPSWAWLNGTHTPPSGPITTGTLTFPLPTVPGSYEARLLNRGNLGGYQQLAVSAPITVAPLVVDILTSAELVQVRKLLALMK